MTNNIFARAILGGEAIENFLADECAAMGISLRRGRLPFVVEEFERLTARGYDLNRAKGSLYLMIRKIAGELEPNPFFRLMRWDMSTAQTEDESPTATATVKIEVGPKDSRREMLEISDGNGPVDAIDKALRKALSPRFPEISRVIMEDFRVNAINPQEHTRAKVLALVTFRDASGVFTVCGVNANIGAAVTEAICTGYEYSLCHSA